MPLSNARLISNQRSFEVTDTRLQYKMTISTYTSLGTSYTQFDLDVQIMNYFGDSVDGFVGVSGSPSSISLPSNGTYRDVFTYVFPNFFFLHNDYQDLQLALIYFTKNSLGFDVNGNSILNAADATTQGIEVEFFAAPSPNLRVNGSVTFLEAEYDDFPYTNADGSVTNLSGYRLQNAPEITANFGFDYSWRTGNGEMMLSAIYKYNDEKFNTSLLNTPRSTIQETDLIDANLMWTPDSDDWSVNFWVKNIADERYISSVFEAPGVLAIVNFLPPREYGISFDFNW